MSTADVRFILLERKKTLEEQDLVAVSLAFLRTSRKDIADVSAEEEANRAKAQRLHEEMERATSRSWSANVAYMNDMWDAQDKVKELQAIRDNLPLLYDNSAKMLIKAYMDGDTRVPKELYELLSELLVTSLINSEVDTALQHCFVIAEQIRSGMTIDEIRNQTVGSLDQVDFWIQMGQELASEKGLLLSAPDVIEGTIVPEISDGK